MKATADQFISNPAPKRCGATIVPLMHVCHVGRWVEGSQLMWVEPD